MKIGIITDSHDHHINILKAVDILNDEKVDYILHAGDIISPIAAKAFSEVKDSQFIAVFGNCDGEKLLLQSTIEAFGGQIHDQPYIGQITDKKIFMTHTPGALGAVIDSGRYDLVIYGHTHKQDIRKAGKSLVINPGELTDWVTGRSDLVVLQLDDMGWEKRAVSRL
ncbi:MAG: YfcE family phosphodiesterase [Planctomycetes bacterium]|nr:YfcE family phosphodiesterase [Planctomycetota bacterium]